MYSNRIPAVIVVAIGTLIWMVGAPRWMLVMLVVVSLYLVGIAVRAWWTGATFGHWTTIVYTRLDRPGLFYAYFLVRLLAGVLGLALAWFVWPRVFP